MNLLTFQSTGREQFLTSFSEVDVPAARQTLFVRTISTGPLGSKIPTRMVVQNPPRLSGYTEIKLYADGKIGAILPRLEGAPDQVSRLAGESGLEGRPLNLSTYQNS